MEEEKIELFSHNSIENNFLWCGQELLFNNTVEKESAVQLNSSIVQTRPLDMFV